MDDDIDYLAIELEALQATYGQERVRLHGDRCICVHVTPSTAEDELCRYVEVTLVFRLPPGYPESGSPQLSMQDARGLGDTRERHLLAQLCKETQQLSGELMLGHLCEVAKDYLTSENHPASHCIFCLDTMALTQLPQPGCSDSPSALLKLPCYHVFHSECFIRWWLWQQAAWAEEERSLIRHTGATSVATLLAEKVPSKEQLCQLYQAGCPVCRAPCPLSVLPHVRDHMRAAAPPLEHQDSDDPPSSTESEHEWLSRAAQAVLSGSLGTCQPKGAGTGSSLSLVREGQGAQGGERQELAQLLEANRRQQERHRHLFERQARKGAIIGIAATDEGEPKLQQGAERPDAGASSTQADRPQTSGRPGLNSAPHHQRQRSEQQAQQLGRGAGRAPQHAHSPHSDGGALLVGRGGRGGRGDGGQVEGNGRQRGGGAGGVGGVASEQRAGASSAHAGLQRQQQQQQREHVQQGRNGQQQGQGQDGQQQCRQPQGNGAPQPRPQRQQQQGQQQQGRQGQQHQHQHQARQGQQGQRAEPGLGGQRHQLHQEPSVAPREEGQQRPPLGQQPQQTQQQRQPRQQQQNQRQQQQQGNSSGQQAAQPRRNDATHATTQPQQSGLQQQQRVALSGAPSSSLPGAPQPRTRCSTQHTTLRPPGVNLQPDNASLPGS